jgi:putative Holliday junction resolvase
MIWLALDVGEARIGLAKGDPSGTLASPIGYIDGKDVDHAIARIRAKAEEIGAEGLLVGVPLSGSGEIGPQARKVLEFVALLRKRTGLPVMLEDEAYTSADGHAALADAGKRRISHRKRIDAAAAAILLQKFLDRGEPQDQSIFLTE